MHYGFCACFNEAVFTQERVRERVLLEMLFLIFDGQSVIISSSLATSILYALLIFGRRQSSALTRFTTFT